MDPGSQIHGYVEEHDEAGEKDARLGAPKKKHDRKRIKERERGPEQVEAPMISVVGKKAPAKDVDNMACRAYGEGKHVQGKH